MSKPLYCIDTSGLIDWLERYYPPTFFPAIIERVDALIDEERIFLSEEVWEEVQTKDEVAKSWCEPRKDQLIIPTDSAVVIEVRSILKSHERLVMNLKNRNRADPFVIAVAKLKNATVITGEVGGTANRPKIPYVCEQIGVDCTSFLDLIRREGWTF
ncbi:MULTISPECIES: DUF4411 family protein [Nocardia]|uniref:DUF4411 family protein n=1 Tax=Nocardia TaxID=1817 RepID=UPI002453C951|nr:MULTISPECIES: DUF4411 family protein [Nocardia]